MSTITTNPTNPYCLAFIASNFKPNLIFIHLIIVQSTDYQRKLLYYIMVSWRISTWKFMNSAETKRHGHIKRPSRKLAHDGNIFVRFISGHQHRNIGTWSNGKRIILQLKSPGPQMKRAVINVGGEAG